MREVKFGTCFLNRFLGLGRPLSVSPSAVPATKEAVRAVESRCAAELAAAALNEDSVAAVRRRLASRHD
jgi:multiphosphoryl transfer protein